jgi:GTP-binding protein
MNGLQNLPSVAIVGRPNVGKSALFNRLVGRRIAIVHDQPGITRDRLSATCARGARPFVLWDTGGIFGAGEAELDAQVRRAAEEALRESDVVLFVVDARQGLSAVDRDVARILRKARKPVVLVINKIDAAKHETLAAEFDSLGFERSVSISAEHGRGVLDLLSEIEQLLPSPAGGKAPALQAERPTAVAVLGRPNAGKSSFINFIVHSERAIVSELPGTTRDAIDISFERDGRRFLFIDTAGIRRRGKRSTAVEIFSVMRAERSLRRADLCVLLVDLTEGVTAQDKHIAGLIQKAHKPAVIVLNKWDLLKPQRRAAEAIRKLVDLTRQQIFFLDYAPVLVVSAKSGENVERLFAITDKIRSASQKRISTGILNRLLQSAFAANPPPLLKGKRLKLLYATQSGAESRQEGTSLAPPEFVLFVNDPRLLSDDYRRYLEARIRETEPFTGLPVILKLRPRVKDSD